MDNLKLLAVLTGIFWGIWPLLLKSSGLAGNFSTVIFTTTILLCTAPFTIKNIGNIIGINWWMAIGAGIFGALGLATFNTMLGKATPEVTSRLFVVAIITQLLIPIIYNFTISGNISPIKILGFIFAIISAILLTI